MNNISARYNKLVMLTRRIILLCISLIVSLLIAEILLGKYFPQKTYASLYKNAISCFAESEVTVFTLKPNCTIPFTDIDTGQTFYTKTNSLGYRGEDISLIKPAGEKRIYLAGDSFILGFGVKDEDLASTRLKNQLSKINKFHPLFNSSVINAGYTGGFGPDGYFLQLKNEGIKLEPDLVVFSIFAYNDLSDIDNDEWIGTGEYGQPEKIVSQTTVVDQTGRLLPRQSPFIYSLPLIRDSQVAVLIYQSATAINQTVRSLSDRIRFRFISPNLPTGQARDSNLPGPYTNACVFGTICHRKIYHLFTDLISTIKASSGQVNSLHEDSYPHFVVLLIPADFQLYPETVKKYNDSGLPYDIASQTDPNPQRRIKEMLDKEKIPYIDLLPIFRASFQRLYFPTDGHWNKEGHKLAAFEIARWIETNYR